MTNFFRYLKNIIFSKYMYIPIIYIYIYCIKEPLRQAWTWYFSKKIKNMHNTARILGFIHITDYSKLYLDKYTRIGKDCYFFSNGEIYIGEGSILSRNITIYTGNHDILGGAIPYDNNYIFKKVIIGKGVWIGMNVNITPGVKIGDGAIIGMGTTISKDVEPYSIVVGAQQRVVSYRSKEDFIRKLDGNLFFSKKWPDL
ncbi:DapH/DapD/GlmU-related protein [Acinetobacter sp. YZS-X1-1]|uniref:acyltransferase n=1 Tax=Acinetobacter sp. YZS-X1-1 TaxID=1501691 RepID=UPI00137929B4|nr:acyltransferase [Acinetobacter sp. YZS-X1-1]